MPHQEALTRKQQTFVLALLSEPTMQGACNIAGISDDTGRRWLRLPHVQGAYQQAQQEVFDAGIAELKSALPDAVRTLIALHKDEEAPAATRARAAQIVIEQAINLHKMSELEAKIAEIEQAIKDRR